jgi:hypothetical protein
VFKKIALVIVVLVGGLLASAATRPDTMHVERTVSIHARPDSLSAATSRQASPT